MARPIKYNVDYFPHYISSGKKMSVLQSRYGNDGYAVWFKLLEQLASTDFHYLDLNNKLDFHYLANNVCLVSEETLVKILNDLAEFGEINAELWKIKVVWSEKFMRSIADAYKRRECKTKDLAGLLCHIKDNNHKLAGLLHTLSTLNEHLPGLMHTETELMSTKSTEREREREIKGKEKEIDKEKTKTHSSTTTTSSISDFVKMEEVMETILQDKNSMLEIGGVAKIPNPKDIPELIREFFSYQKLAGKIHQDGPNFKKHFVTWYSRRYPNNASEKQKNNELPPDRSGEFDKERIGKWMWLNNDWRDTTTFAEHRKQHYGIK